MRKYYLKQDRQQQEETEGLMHDLRNSASRIDDFENAKYNVDNCACPECPCCDPDMKWLWPVGAGVLAASTAVLTAATAAEIASK